MLKSDKSHDTRCRSCSITRRQQGMGIMNVMTRDVEQFFSDT